MSQRAIFITEGVETLSGMRGVGGSGLYRRCSAGWITEATLSESQNHFPLARACVIPPRSFKKCCQDDPACAWGSCVGPSRSSCRTACVIPFFSKQLWSMPLHFELCTGCLALPARLGQWCLPAWSRHTKRGSLSGGQSCRGRDKPWLAWVTWRESLFR